MEETLQTLQDNPIDFIELAFGCELWQKQRQIVESVKDTTYTAVKSCHGSGKSFIAARTALWFLYSHPNSKVITTAPTFIQVENILWRELRAAHSRSRINLGGKVNTTNINLGEEWFAIGLSTNEPDRFQGYHAVDILLIVDEAAGVSEEIFEASEGIVSSERARVLYLGNPTNVAGTFYKSFKLPQVKKIHIGAWDTPNFTTFGITKEDITAGTWQEKITGPLPAPWLVTPAWVADKVTRWGVGTPMWDARIEGDFPTQGDNTLIPLSLIEAAQRRSLLTKDGDPERIGVDVARFGVDKTEMCYRKGPKPLDWQTIFHMDTVQVSGKTRHFMALHPFASVGIDVIGIGAGVVDTVKANEPYKDVTGVNVAMPANDAEQFLNLRAEMYWSLRQRFMDGDIDLSSLPPDVMEDLSAQLANILFEYTTKGQIKIESKEELTKRGLPSPDKADALMLAFGNVQRKPSLLEYMGGIIR